MDIIQGLVQAGSTAGRPALRIVSNNRTFDVINMVTSNVIFSILNDGSVGAGSTIYTNLIANYVDSGSSNVSTGGSGAGVSSQWTTVGTKIYYNLGNIGIGATDPIAPLHIYNATNARLLLDATTTGTATLEFRRGTGGDAQNDFRFINDSNSSFKLQCENPAQVFGNAIADLAWFSSNETIIHKNTTMNGRVGVGTVYHATRTLDVVGDANVSGTVSVGNLNISSSNSVTITNTITSNTTLTIGNSLVPLPNEIVVSPLPTEIVVAGTTFGTIGTTDRYVLFPYSGSGITKDYTFTTTENLICDILVVGGGGGGGNDRGGGGGGGGVIYSQNITLNGTYTIMVGKEGVGGTTSGTTGGTGTRGTNGSNSSISGTNITTITAIGGGGGGGCAPSGPRDGLSGGSGGGGSHYLGAGSGGTGTTGQGSNGGIGFEWGGGGGGGGAVAVGTDATSTNAGNGGVGLSNSITGISVIYGSGGGGGGAGSGSGSGMGFQQIGTGGSIGAGNGSIQNVNANNATIFGCGGGGAGHTNGATTKGGNGFAGVVIIRYRKPPSETVTSSIIPGTTDRYLSFPYSGSATTKDYTITTTENLTCDVLVVGGGGAGGNSMGGGGGAGGVVYAINQTLSTGTYTVKVGRGGIGATLDAGGEGTYTANQDGGESSLMNSNGTSYISLTLGGVSRELRGFGGGGGGVYYNNLNGRNGGSGGGSTENNPTYALTTPGSALQPATYWDGSTYVIGGKSGRQNTTTAQDYQAGGGGGLGNVSTDYRNGNDGVTISIIGTSQLYAAGGGAGQYINASTSAGIGGSGIGGNGRVWNGSSYSREATSGATGTGSGGGGGSYIQTPYVVAGSGGSGIVIIRYRRIITSSTATINLIRGTVADANHDYMVGNYNGEFKVISSVSSQDTDYIRITTAGAITNPTGTASWNTGSDRRIKENIERASYDKCYENINKLELNRFNYVSGFNTVNRDKTQLGFIAQEVNDIFPKSISSQEYYTNELCIPDLLSIDITQINYSLYGAVKKLIKINKDQETKFDTFDRRLKTIETALNIVTEPITSNIIVEPSTSNIIVDPIEPTTSNIIVDPIEPTTSNIIVDPIEPTTSNIIVDPIEPTTSNIIVDPIEPITSNIIVDPIEPTTSNLTTE